MHLWFMWVGLVCGFGLTCVCVRLFCVSGVCCVVVLGGTYGSLV